MSKSEPMPVFLDEALRLTPQQRADMEKEALRKIKAGRVSMIRGPDTGGGVHRQRPQDAFFSVLVMKLEPVKAWWVATMATNGKKLYYNPAFTCQLDHEVVLGVLAHECMHPAMGHHARLNPKDGYDPHLANIACDLAINLLLLNDGYKLPEWACVPGKGPFADLEPGRAAEVYYEKLKEEHDKVAQQIKERVQFVGGGDGESGGSGKERAPDAGGCGGVLFEEDDAERANSEQEWKQNVAEAAIVAKQCGKLPAGLESIIEDVLRPKVPWHQVLREYVRKLARSDYTWSRPNRRYIAQDMYLPGLHSEDIGDLVVHVDTSGSCCGKSTMETFFGELIGIIEGVKARVTLIECDCAVHRVRTWEPDEGTPEPSFQGGGGTSHVPVWEEIRNRDLDPTVVISLTDGYTQWGDDPGYPVIFVIVDNEECKAPFGVTINISTAEMQHA